MKPLVTDALWERLQPLLPPPRRLRFPGRKPLASRSRPRIDPGAVPGPFRRNSPGRGGSTAVSRTPCSAPSNVRGSRATSPSSSSCSTPGCGSRNCAP